ncbi:MAG: hypothetical protein C0507_25380 [Cyanobacteria bacterium PR.3.49]|jgi:hypothetical protein|nr:hypothetical protein [Cyanobacteria bacterium PR.3.49]
MLLEKRLLKLLVARDLLEKGEEEQAMHLFRSAIKDCPQSDKWLVDSFVTQLEGFSDVKDIA